MRRRLAATVLAASLGAGTATADPVADFYRGKTVNLRHSAVPASTPTPARKGLEINYVAGGTLAKLLADAYSPPPVVIKVAGQAMNVTGAAK